MPPRPSAYALLLVACLLGAGSVQAGPAPDLGELAELYHPYRADARRGPANGTPTRVRLLPPGGAAAWPEPLRRDLAERVRNEWVPSQVYGPVRAGVGVWLTYPLVTAAVSTGVAVPVLESGELAVSGVVDLPRESGPRRVVVLIDASQSANTPILFRNDAGREQRMAVLEAERRAVLRLLDGLDGERVELGVIAFGESTWPIARPGASTAELRAALEGFRRAHPRGVGRTDAVCALWTARDWLEGTPDGVAREVVLVTDGDLPHSGRFTDCSYSRGGADGNGRARCEERRNTSACPASHRFRGSDGTSDQVQLSAFARAARSALGVHVLVFETDRSAAHYKELARRTGGVLARVPSAAAVEAALPALVSRQVKGVRARNATLDRETPDLYDPASHGFEGSLPLAPGPNDVEIRVESASGLAALYRYRVYSLPGALRRYLAELRGRNRALDTRIDALRSGRPSRAPAAPARDLEVLVDDAE